MCDWNKLTPGRYLVEYRRLWLESPECIDGEYVPPPHEKYEMQKRLGEILLHPAVAIVTTPSHYSATSWFMSSVLQSKPQEFAWGVWDMPVCIPRFLTEDVEWLNRGYGSHLKAVDLDYPVVNDVFVRETGGYLQMPGTRLLCLENIIHNEVWTSLSVQLIVPRGCLGDSPSLHGV